MPLHNTRTNEEKKKIVCISICVTYWTEWETRLLKKFAAIKSLNLRAQQCMHISISRREKEEKKVHSSQIKLIMRWCVHSVAVVAFFFLFIFVQTSFHCSISKRKRFVRCSALCDGKYTKNFFYDGFMYLSS